MPDYNFDIGVQQSIAGITELNKKMDELIASVNKLGEATKKQQTQTKQGTKQQRDEMAKLKAEIRRTERDFVGSEKKKAKALDALKVKYDRLAVAMQKTGKVAQTGANNAAAAQSRLNKQVSLGRQLFLRLKSVMLTVFGAYAFIQGIRNTINTVKEFELGVARVQAITGATAEEIDRLASSARILAGAGIFNPTEITELQVKLAKLGFTLEEIAGATKGIIDLATATGEDLAVSAELVASVIRGLGLEASETQRIVDVLGKSFTSSALDITKFKESAKFILPLARQMGWSIEEVAATLGKLSDSLISGSLAGTGLRTLFIELADDTSELSGIMGQGVNTFDEFVDALIKMQEEGVSTAEVLAAVPKRAVTLTTVLLAQGEGLRDYAKKLQDANGAIEEMADIQMETLANQLDRLGSAWDSFILSVQQSGGVLTDAVSLLADLFNYWAFLGDPESFGIEAATRRVASYANAIRRLGDDLKIARIDEVVNAINDALVELDAITSKDEKTLAFIAQLREELKLLGELKDDITFDRELRAVTEGIEDRAIELQKAGKSSSEAFELAYREAVTKIGETIRTMMDTVKEEQEGLETVLGVSPEFNEEARHQLKLEADARINYWTRILGALQEYFFEEFKTKEKSDKLSKDQAKNLLSLQKQLELQNASLIRSTRKREEAILEINTRYAKLNYQLDLKYDDLTLEERRLINDLIKSGEEVFQKELLDLRERYRDEDLDAAREAAEQQITIQEDLFAIRLQEMKNAGASEQEILRETLKFEIQILKARIANAKALGLSVELIEDYARQIELAGAKLDGIVGDETVDVVEENTKKIANAYKKLASEIIDSLQTIVDAQVENTERLVSDLDTRIAETQRSLDQEIQLYTEGYANNVSAKREELQKLKEARDQALKDREVAVRRQQQLEAISQAANLFSAVAKTINTYSSIPGVGFGIAAGVVAAFLGLFKASQASIKNITQFGSGGKVDGDSHANGGVLIEAEGGEFVVRKSAYEKYAPLVNAINEDDVPTINKNVLSSTTFNKKGDKVVVDNAIWTKMYNLWEKNLSGENVQIVGAKKISTRGIKKRITNV